MDSNASLMASAQAAMTNETAALALLNPSSSDAGLAEVVAYLDETTASLTHNDYLAVAFDIDNNASDRAIFDALTENKDAFTAWREDIARAEMHMELAEYSALFEQHRSSLLDLAASLGITVQVHQVSFDALLRKVDAEVSLRERRAPKGVAAAVDARALVSGLYEHAYLFNSRTTLHPLIAQDAIQFGLGAQIGKAIDWVMGKVNTYKCQWCQSIVKSIREKMCDFAGKKICTLLVDAMTGPLGLIADKFFCGFPVHLDSVFAGWCVKGVEWIQRATKVTDNCVCSFTVPTFTFKAHEFTVFGKVVYRNKARSVALGQICIPKAGTCAK